LGMKPINRKYFTYIELSALVLTVLLKYLLMDWLGMRAFYIAGICLFWSGYIAYRYSLDHSILRSWGLQKENFGKSLRVLLPFLIISVFLTIIFGKINHIPIINLNIIPVLVLYPLWGIIQQFMVVCILVQNLQNLPGFSLRMNRAILLPSILFSLIHYPHFTLMAFTFIMEIIFITVFQRWRNLWSLGIAHGWIASFVLYYFLNRDLWVELFAWF